MKKRVHRFARTPRSDRDHYEMMTGFLQDDVLAMIAELSMSASLPSATPVDRVRLEAAMTMLGITLQRCSSAVIGSELHQLAQRPDKTLHERTRMNFLIAQRQFLVWEEAAKEIQLIREPPYRETSDKSEAIN